LAFFGRLSFPGSKLADVSAKGCEAIQDRAQAALSSCCGAEAGDGREEAGARRAAISAKRQKTRQKRQKWAKFSLKSFVLIFDVSGAGEDQDDWVKVVSGKQKKKASPQAEQPVQKKIVVVETPKIAPVGEFTMSVCHFYCTN